MPIDRGVTRTSDESFRYYFADPMEYRRAMERAAYLESIKCPLRAWRVRLNLDGEIPHYEPPVAEPDEEIIEKPKKTYVRKPRDRSKDKRKSRAGEHKKGNKHDHSTRSMG
jgi:hypothetical protein